MKKKKERKEKEKEILSYVPPITFLEETGALAFMSFLKGDKNPLPAGFSARGWNLPGDETGKASRRRRKSILRLSKFFLFSFLF